MTGPTDEPARELLQTTAGQREVKVRLSSSLVLRLHREKILHGTTIGSIIEEAVESYLRVRAERAAEA